jgi:hypothetical protein
MILGKSVDVDNCELLLARFRTAKTFLLADGLVGNTLVLLTLKKPPENREAFKRACKLIHELFYIKIIITISETYVKCFFKFLTTIYCGIVKKSMSVNVGFGEFSDRLTVPTYYKPLKS